MTGFVSFCVSPIDTSSGVAPHSVNHNSLLHNHIHNAKHMAFEVLTHSAR